MSSLYGRLFKYQANDKQTQRENYLTEAFCDLLNRLGKEQHTFLKKLDLFECEEAVDPLDFKTQVAIKTKNGNRHPKRPDLVGYIGKTPVLVIEVKVDAQFTENQLPEYGMWLDKEGHEDAVLALLTWGTPPPEDFVEGGAGYGIAKLRVVRWWDVRRELEALQGPSDSIYRMLAKEFIAFLHEQGVAMEMPKKDDFPTLVEYLRGGTAARWENFMNSIHTQLKEVAMSKEIGLSWNDRQPPHGGTFQYDQALIGWLSTDRPKIQCVEWGLWLADGGADNDFISNYGIPLQSGAYLYVWYTEPQACGDTRNDDEWYPLLRSSGKANHARQVAFQALDSFCGDAGKLTQWFKEKFEQACVEIVQYAN